MSRKYPRGEHPYGRAYNAARRRILGPAGKGDLTTDPACHWRGPTCTGVATTADHDPPLAETGAPHTNLVPACGPCNFGRGQRSTPLRHYPGPSRDW